MYKIDKNDPEIINRAKREANALLIYTKNTYIEDKEAIEKLKLNLANIISIIYTFAERFSTKDHKTISKFVDKIINEEILSPLTLKDDEFNDNGINIRSPRIIKRNGKIYDLKAFDFEVKHVYDNVAMEEISTTVIINNESYINSHIVHINAGGVFTGKSIRLAAIRQESIDKGIYTPKNTIHLPVSIIKEGVNIWITVDKREPKLKAIKEFFNVEEFEDKFKSKFDVRKYKKLSKKDNRKKEK